MARDVVNGTAEAEWGSDWYLTMAKAIIALTDEREALALRAVELEAANEIHEPFARAADAFCWDPETTTHADLMEARARWQAELGRLKLRALAATPSGEGQ